MDKCLTQRIPSGAQTPQEQVEYALEVMRQAALLLDCQDTKSLEMALESLRPGLTCLAAAGVLLSLALTVSEQEVSVGIQVVFDLTEVSEVQAVDLSSLALVADPTGRGKVEIVCPESALARALVEAELLSALDTKALRCCQVRWLDPEETLVLTNDEEEEEEDDDGHDDVRWGEFGGEGDGFYGQ